jgi:hypothetical protein
MIEGKTITPENPLFFVFNPIKNTLDRDKEKYKSISEKRKESGKKGGLSKGKQTKAKKANAKFANQTIANEADNDNDSVNVNENDNVNANFKKWSEDDLIKSMTPYSERYTKEMLNTFYNYWKEPLPNGKLRLTAQDAWDTGRRLATWKKIESSKQPEQKVVTRASMGVKMQ